MKTICNLILPAILLAILAVPASAELTMLDIENSNPAEVPGYVVNDLKITFTGEWLGTQVLTSTLDSAAHPGAAIFHNGSSNTPPDSDFFPIFPAREYDTFMANGGYTAQTTGGVFEVGNAANIPGHGQSIGGVFNASQIDKTWAPALGTNPTDLSDYFIGRFTIADDVSGTFSIIVTAGEDIGQQMEGRIDFGKMYFGVPEPSSFVLAGLGLIGALGLVWRRKRKA